MQQSFPGISPSISDWKGSDIVNFQEELLQKVNARTWAFPVIIGILLVLGWFWPGWWLWVGLLFMVGRNYAEPLDQITELDPKRRALAIFAIVLFFLVLSPVPMISL